MQKTIEEVEIFYDGLDHPECVAIHTDGSVWAGGEAGQIYKISPDGKQCELIANTGGFVLGIAFSPDHQWLAICDLKKKCIWKLDLRTASLTCLFTHIQGRAINIPNYPVFDSEGNLYVSDSGAFRQVNGCIYKIKSTGAATIWHEGPFNFPNGMCLSHDKKYLYVACTWLPGVEAVAITEDGSAGERKILIEIKETCPDGICTGSDGDLYISCYSPNTIYRLNKSGALSTFIHDWEAHTICNPTNMAVSPDGNYMYVANLGRWHIARIQLTSIQNNQK